MKIELENIGKHKSFSFDLEPGVTILKGPNGAGKTTVLNATAAALGGVAKVERRDGGPPGIVKVDGGVTIKIGARLSHDGEPSVQLGGFAEIEDIVDPGVKDPVKADAARIKAILSMANIPVDEAAKVWLTGGKPALANGGPTDSVLDLAEYVRTRANKLAKEHEDQAKVDTGAAQAALSSIVGMVPPEGAVLVLDVAQAAARAATEALGKVQALHEQRVQQEEQVARIRDGLGERPVSSDDEVKSLEAKHEEAVGDMLRALTAAQVADVALNTARSEVKLHEQRVIQATKDRDVAKLAQERWDRQRAVVDAPVTGPTKDEVYAAKAAVDLALKDAESARVAETITKSTRAAEEYKAKAAVSSSSAEELRTISRAVGDNLGEILKAHHLPGMSISGGRLMATLDGDDVLFADRMSEGQRVIFALRIAMRSYPGGAIGLRRALWSSLQPSVQDEVVAFAHEQKLYLFTEEVVNGEGIEVEHR